MVEKEMSRYHHTFVSNQTLVLNVLLSVSCYIRHYARRLMHVNCARVFMHSVYIKNNDI